MSAGNLTRPAGNAGAAARPEKTGAGGAAGIEIVGFPQTLYTRTFGDPDMLFVPLLGDAREAYAMCERLAGHGENRATAVKLSGMQLASSLLSGREGAKSGLQVIDPLASFGHVHGGVGEQSGEKLHAAEGIANFMSQHRGDFRQGA
jgi:hypothetical protein